MLRVLLVLLLVATEAFSQNYKGLSLSTDYPYITTLPGKLLTLQLKVHNYELPPQRVNLELIRKPKDWQTVFVGGGNLVQAVFVAPGDSANVELWIEPPANATPGNYDFLVQAEGNNTNFRLPITVILGKTLPGRLSISADFPSLEGNPKTQFSYKLTIKNTSAADALVNLKASAPPAFDVHFSEVYGDKELNSIPIPAGQTKDISVKITPPNQVPAGTYQVAVSAFTESAQAQQDLSLVIRGTPSLLVTGPEGRISLDAVAGHESSVKLTVKNTGSADAQNVSLTASEPSDWKVEFEPKAIESIPAGKSSEVRALITPTNKALAGDYMITFRADEGSNISASQDFRITVHTSTLWGIIAVLIIAVALGVATLAIRRYGRR